MERRRAERFSVDVGVEARIDLDGQSRRVFGRGKDLSIHGMAVFLPVDLAIGATTTLKVTLPHTSEVLKVEARICNRHSYQYGVEFLDCDSIEATLIERSCRYLRACQ